LTDNYSASYSAPFIAMFESLGMGPRFQRGRRDARAGHVRNLSISSSLVVAQVRGPDEPVAHRARIAVRAFGAAEWARIEDELAAEARHVADLLAGRMPVDIDVVVARAGLQLLPLSISEVAMDCGCERWPMPCTHLAAACYALGAAFDTDPFGVLAWRGRGRDELLERLRQLRGVATPAPQSAQAAAVTHGLDLENFWGTPPAGPPTATATPCAVTAPTGAAGFGLSGLVGARHPEALLDQLTPLPLAVDGHPVVDLLRPAYRAMVADPD
jgi:uncharacterized Zn finger protein